LENDQPTGAGLPPSLLWPLRSVVERLDVRALFPADQPLEVELGSGDGSFLIQYSRLHPERNFLGVERLLGRLRKLDRKGLRAGLTNLRGLRIEAAYCVQYLLPAHSVQAFHIYFPDPWPKRRHWPRRLVDERFPGLALQALAPEGVVYLRTDDALYFAQMQAVFEAHPAFAAVETQAELAEVKTDFERDFTARGVTTLRAAYQRLSS
jgi:tRNA (guanine-N7-)-methyltransferase